MADAVMHVQCSIQDGEIWFRNDREGAVHVEIEEV